MNRLLTVLVVGGVLGSAGRVSAGEPLLLDLASRLFPSSTLFQTTSRPRPELMPRDIPTGQLIVPPAPAAEGGPAGVKPLPQLAVAGKPAPVETIQLYHCVRYEDVDEAHPCGVPKIVAVQDPCYNPRSCCCPGYVYVQICVPPCGCPRIKVSRNGQKVKYDYGKYEIEIKSKYGVVEVEYDY